MQSVVGVPELSLVVSTTMDSGVVPEGSAITVPVGERELHGIAGSTERQLDGSSLAPIRSDRGEKTCKEECAMVLPVPGPAEVRAEFVIADDASGPMVPVSALRTTPGGKAIITLAGGSNRDVEVVVSHGGLAIVSGVEVGEQVQLFGDGQ